MRLIAAIYTSFSNQFLEPFIDLLFDQMYIAGEFSPPPDIMLEAGGKIDVIFDSPLATTQVIDELQAMDEFSARVMAFAAQELQATGKPSDILDIADWTDYWTEYARKLKVPSGPMRSQQAIATLRQSRAEAEQKQAMQQGVMGMAEAAGKAAPMMKVLKDDQKAA